MTHTSAPPFPGKSPDLLPLGDGLNFSTPLGQVEGTVVPTPLFFLRSNNPVPSINPATWRLDVQGRVKKPLRVGLADLQALPSETHEVWLECAGNSRRRWNPAAEGNQWDDQAVSNAVFRGVPLRILLEQASVEPDATELVTSGADADNETESGVFQRGLPLEVARLPGVILAYEMNGQPLPGANGGPVRLLVPGWAGIASVKWPVRMEVTAQPFDGYYNAQRYIMVDANGRTQRTVRQMPVKSVIAWPAEGETLPPGPCTLFGFAWSGYGPIERVEVSLDDNDDEPRTWRPARLVRGSGPLAWTRWEFDWSAPAGQRVRLGVRAADAAGNVQPAQAGWNRFGYEQNAIAVRALQVRAS